MIQYSWVIKNVSANEDEMGILLEKIANGINAGMTLCASVGCECVVQAGVETKHETASMIGTYIHTGPRWRNIISSLDGKTVKVDVYVEGPVYGHEIAGAERALKGLNLPLFALRSGSNI